MLFNRRQSGEAHGLLCERYRNRNCNENEDLARGLSNLERKLMKKFVKVTVMGKRGRPVPILFTAVLQNQVDVLTGLRAVVGILDTNPYVFAQSGSNDPVRSSDRLRMLAVSCAASKPHPITSTKLRKHVARMSQIMNLKRNELDILAYFWDISSSFIAIITVCHKVHLRWPKSARYC